MAGFSYRAVDAKGRTAKGVIEAASAAAARRTLRARHLLPIAVEPSRKRAGRTPAPDADGASAATPSGGARLGVRALTLVTRQLATLIGSGVRIEDALGTVARQSGAARQAGLLHDIRALVLDGRSLAAALDEYPQVFGDFYRASVRAGEASGQLGAVMEHLARHVETRAANRQTLQLALIYPALLALVSLGVIIALLTFVVPDIVRVFSARGAELPLLTRALIGASDGLSRYGPAMLATLLGAGALALWLLRSPARRLRWHAFLLRLPLVRGFVLKVNTAQFAATLATLVVSRVPLVDALAAAAQTVSNLAVRQHARAVAGRVREGGALSQSMTEAGIFPPMLIAMVASGEASGTLGESLERAAADQSRDIDALVATVVALVEPGVLLLMGGMVMILVLAILLPIMGMNTLVG